MRSRNIILSMASGLLLVASAGLAGTRTVQVDCDGGDSIERALRRRADELIIEISGFCREHVAVQRDNVTLIGADPLADGVEGPTEDTGYSGLVEIQGRGVRLENLGLKNSARWGLWSGAFSTLVVRNCRLEDSADAGAWLGEGTAVSIFDATFARNSTGIVLRNAVRAICMSCDFEDNTFTDVAAQQSSSISLVDSALSAPEGVEARDRSFIRLDDSTVDSAEAAAASHYSEVLIYDTTLTGSIRASVFSRVQLRNVVQTANPQGYNLIDDRSGLSVWGDEDSHTELRGELQVRGFSSGDVLGWTDLFDDISCDDTSDARCDPSRGTVSGVSTCGLCPVPAP